jgi:catechol 2,3-dioxygenase-like lactoylglutathione lyase family enzyme
MIAAVEIEVRDLAAAERFYGELLGFRDERARLVEAAREYPDWADETRQLGVRHLALYVGDVDAEAARLQAAGVEFTTEPTDVAGDVRLAFFHDPDGTVLELISQPPNYHRTLSLDLAARERADLPGPDDPPRLAHLAITVERPPEEDVIGELMIEDEGLVATFVAAPVPLEFFSFPDGELLPEAEGNLKAVSA